MWRIEARRECMSLRDLETNHADTTYGFSLSGTDFAVGGELSSQDPNNCIFIQDVQGLDTFDFHLLRQGVTIDLDPNGGTSFVTDLEGSPEAKIICDSLIENAIGGRANDVIFGNDVGNVITGGLGGDHLTGGSGSDTFNFNGINSSLNRAGLFDTIEDFSSGEDVIKLNQIDADPSRPGNNAFDFIGNHAFTHHAGELRLTSNNVLLGDVTGDGHADFRIVVHGDHVLVSDILL
jgi:Ca2+-binding RTX toxin-like protein